MKLNSIAVLILLALTPLFFTTISGHQTALEKRLWDLGHLPFFMLLSFAFLPYVKQKMEVSKKPIFVVFQFICFIFILAAGVELVQLMVGRKASFSDLRKDTLGIVITFQAYLLFNEIIDKIWKFSCLFTVLWCLFELYPISEAALDRWRMGQSMPNLANFETKAELSRWSEGSYERLPSEVLTFSEDFAAHPKEINSHVLKIALNTKRYTGIVGAGLFRDWSEYKVLQFDIYNPNDYLLRLNLKIEDTSAMSGNMAYHNRFNGIYELHPGSSRIRVSLDEIANAPREREMDLSAIHRLSLFFSRLPESSFIYLDNVMLVK